MKKTCLIGLLLLILPAAMTAGQGIYLDHIDGLNAEGWIEDGTTLTFHMRLINSNDYPIDWMVNGFRFYSDGMTWESLSGEFNPNYNWTPVYGMPCYFDMGAFIKVFSDTIGFAGIKWNLGTGLPVGFDDIAYTITLGPIHPGSGCQLVFDSSSFEPYYEWTWETSSAEVLTCEWGGPYVFEMYGCVPSPYTFLEENPLLVKELEFKVLKVYIGYEDHQQVDLSSVLVNGRIPPYSSETAWVEGDLIVTDVYVFRFLSSYRPIMEDLQTTYTVQYMKVGESEPVVLTGDVLLDVTPGDVTLDGKVDIDDVTFLVDYFWRGGSPCLLKEMMDVDKNGQVNTADVAALRRIAF